MGQRKKPEQRNTKRVAIGGQSDELYLISKFRELSPEQRACVLKVVDMWYLEEHPRRTSRRRLKLVKPKES